MMKNTFCHPSLPSELFSIGGNSEFRMANLEPPSVMDDTTEMNLHSNGYYFHPPSSFPADNNWLRGVGDCLDFSDQHILGLRPGSLYPTSSRSIPHLPVKKYSVRPPADAMSKTRKRPLEAEDRRIAGEDFGESSGSGDRKKSWRKRAVPPPCSSQCRGELSPAGLPVRRSQKISDKITALQKLVSPYGKTDTASVLQEASLYIKLLQDQIQMLTNSYASIRGMHPQLVPVHQAHGETSVPCGRRDLRSRGLCIVPISSVCEVAAKNHIGYATMY
ncbi:hypothetical protein MLD38_008746 [Melastoma candidum]|uniref:Uncharacterized protein n=1 Tax=Melastoma candidum TaxID=119954 RepID=A0ACB9RZM1_9MYRT|nr:hypothetical protein MLD38_008746 [Melastoma candidum]